MLTQLSGKICFCTRELWRNTLQHRFICGAILVDVCAPWERRRNLWTTRAYRMAIRRHGTKLASFRGAIDVPSHSLAIVSSERPLPQITNAKCFPRFRDTSGKLKQSNIASSQYATQLIVYACVCAKSERKCVSNDEIFFPVFLFENQIKLFLRQVRE